MTRRCRHEFERKSDYPEDIICQKCQTMMIIMDRLSLPIVYAPKVGDLLQIEEITGGNRGRWYFKVSLINQKDARLSADRKEFIKIVKGMENPYPSNEFYNNSRYTGLRHKAFEACRRAILKEVE